MSEFAAQRHQGKQMSNTLTNLTQNPIVITSSMQKPWRAAVIDSLVTLVARRKVAVAPIFVRQLVWKDGAVGDTLQITDGDRILIHLIGKEVAQSVDFQPAALWRDFQVQISSGTALIFLGKSQAASSAETEDAFDVLVADAATRRFQEYQLAASFCLWCKCRAWIQTAFEGRAGSRYN
jgi:hypothetical protein